MIKLGIIGTENSHAMAFAKLINLPDSDTGNMLYPDMHVAAVFGEDRSTAEKISAEANVELVAASPEEFFGKIDAMMITNRKGSLHLKYALPFVEKGMPVFVDKPFTASVEEAELLADAAKKAGARLCGGSGCKLSYDVLMLQNKVRSLRKKGDFISACMNFAADPASEYDGFFFYSPHLTEMALAVFGPDVRSVISYEKAASRSCIWRYDDCDITLHFTKGSVESSALIFAKSGNYYRSIDISLIYRHEVDTFVQMLYTGQMPQDYDALVQPVRVIAAIEEATRSGKEILL